MDETQVALMKRQYIYDILDGCKKTTQVLLDDHLNRIRTVFDPKSLILIVLTVYLLKENWPLLMSTAGFDDFFDFLEVKIGIGYHRAKKFLRFGQILERRRYLFEKIDIEKIKSLYMLDYLEIALGNHPEKYVIDALQTMGVKEFKMFAHRRPLSADKSLVKHITPKRKHVTVENYVDCSRYKDIMTGSFHLDNEILTVGTSRTSEWEAIIRKLQEEGIQYRVYEGGTKYASIMVDDTNLTLSEPTLSL